MELLVVMAIIIVIASMAALVAPRLRENQKTTRGAEQLQGWLFIAKQEAYRDKLPRGVRLVPDQNNPSWVRECLYIEQPEEYRGGFIQVPSPYAPAQQNPQDKTPWAYAFITRQNAGPPLDLFNTGVLQPGDFLTLDVAPYGSYRIMQVSFQNGNQGGGTQLVLGAADGVTLHPLPSMGNSTLGASINQEVGFHITRQARPRAGEATLKLPKDIIVDLNQGFSLFPGANYNSPLLTGEFNNTLDIIFNPRGGMMGINATSGGNIGSTTILWVRDATKTYPQGEHNLVAIYGRTGFVAAHPVNFSTPNAFNQIDPYLFVRDGKNSGM
jgi:type II secretory pathway pseudopilin PulG